MLPLYLSVVLLVLLAPVRGDQPLENELLRNRRTQTTEPDVEQIRSPLLEVFMHLPRNFRDVASLKNALRAAPARPRRNAVSEPGKSTPPKAIVEVRNYEITQPVFVKDGNSTLEPARTKREASAAKTVAEKPEPEKLVSALTGSVHGADNPPLPQPDAIRGPIYNTYAVKEFDVVDIDDPDDSRRRRIDSSSDSDDSAQRDKRTFLEDGSAESTTPLPFWKRKKENPPFVTGRGSIQSGNSYTPPQHRSGESTRESHSLKTLDKTMQSNEISRSNQDSYYSGTNRRTYSRQYDGPTSSTPKSVYDTIDYSSKPSPDSPRADLPRNHDDKDAPRQTRPHTHEHYSNRNHPPPWIYDRPYYQPAYPFPTDILGRGVEYYHRTYDPTTGRIIYYANMPDHARSYDYRLPDPIARTFYLNRPYPFDPYYRHYLPPFDYRFVNGFSRSPDHLRTARTGSQAYSYPNHDRDKFSRDPRFIGGWDTPTRSKDDLRNKTYIIYDAEENRGHFPRPAYAPDNNRSAYTPAPGNNLSRPQSPFQQFPFPPPDYFPGPAFPNRNGFHSPPTGPGWGLGPRTLPGVTDSKSNSRPLHSPEVQLPLTASNRGDLDKSKKS